MTFSIVTPLCDHLHYLISEHFHYPKKKPVLISSRFSSLLPPGPGNRESIFCLSGFTYSEHFVYMESQFVATCDWLLSFRMMSLRFLLMLLSHVSVLHFFLFLNNTPLYEYNTFCFSSRRLNVWVISRFWLLWIMLWIFVYTFLCVAICFNSIGYIFTCSFEILM